MEESDWLIKNMWFMFGAKFRYLVYTCNGPIYDIIEKQKLSSCKTRT